MREILKYDIDINHGNGLALCTAVMRYRTDIVQVLLDHGARPELAFEKYGRKKVDIFQIACESLQLYRSEEMPKTMQVIDTLLKNNNMLRQRFKKNRKKYRDAFLKKIEKKRNPYYEPFPGFEQQVAEFEAYLDSV